MDARSHFLTLARYNLWATERLVAGHVDALPDEVYRRDCGLFFRSIHGTLNHLLVAGDRVWYPRFAEGHSPKDVQLSDVVEEDRVRLKAGLIESAHRWSALVEGFAPARYDGELDYTTMRGTRAVLPFAATLAHVFNHATHHRGQITAALSALGDRGPELDMVYMLQLEQAARP
jgi:uncharacterized damage-inducible protein DinB